MVGIAQGLATARPLWAPGLIGFAPGLAMASRVGSGRP